MLKFSRRNILIIPHADKALRTLMKKMPAFIVSTSYSQYISAVCDVIGFPFANTYSTLVDLDEFELPEGERSTLKELHRVIMELPDFSLPPGAQSANDLDPAAGKTVQKLDEIFWHVLPEMAAYRIVSKTNPVGGKEKAAAILKILSLTGSHLEDVIYFGDSITDVDAFRLVKSNGGIAVSFNGNSWAIREADVAVTGTHALPIVWLAELFLDYGRDAFDDLGMCRITPEDIPRVSALSGRIRRNVRTEKIGGLG
jgi:energy-converting hydrogenase A subunit R